MKCPACGTENEQGALFCYQCGGPLAARATPSSTGPTVALSPGPQGLPEQTTGVRPAVRSVPMEPRESSGAQIYQVSEDIQLSYSTTIVGAPSRTSSMAIVSLVLGIISFLGIFLIGGIGAVATGHLARREIRASGGSIGGDGMALAGLILGYLNILFCILALIAVCLFIVGASSSVAP